MAKKKTSTTNTTGKIQRTPYKKTDKADTKAADQVILEWFQSNDNAMRYLADGSRALARFGFTKEIWTAINSQSSPPRSLASVWNRVQRWMASFERARMMAEKGQSQQGKCALETIIRHPAHQH